MEYVNYEPLSRAHRWQAMLTELLTGSIKMKNIEDDKKVLDKHKEVCYPKDNIILYNIYKEYIIKYNYIKYYINNNINNYKKYRIINIIKGF